MLDGIGKFVVMTRDVFLHIMVFRIHPYNFKEQLFLVGSKSIFIVLLTAFVIGMVFSLQITDTFTKFGGSSVIGGVLSLAMLRELAPVVSAIVFAGRVGSSISAEISSMKVTQQLDALRVMATSPVYYLAVPRVLASAIMLPLLTAFADIVSILGDTSWQSRGKVPAAAPLPAHPGTSRHERHHGIASQRGLLWYSHSANQLLHGVLFRAGRKRCRYLNHKSRRIFARSHICPQLLPHQLAILPLK